MTAAHFHADEAGVLRRCYHRCRNAKFWLGFLVADVLKFPLEHGLWEKVWPFSAVTHLLHL